MKIIILLFLFPFLCFSQSEPCIFDEKTQDDSFLDSIKNWTCQYNWDNKTKTAIMYMCDGDTIIFYRGGCDVFVMDAKIILQKKEVDLNKVIEWAEPVLWIAKNLPNEFNYKKLKVALENNQYIKLENNKGVELTFNSDELSVNNYKLYYLKNDTKTLTIGLSWYLD